LSKQGYGVPSTAIDGHKCASTGEREIDDFLFKNKIKHLRDFYYPQTSMTCDFVVRRKIFIEYFGLSNFRSYRKKIKRKEAHLKKRSLKLIKIYPEHIKSGEFRGILKFLIKKEK
jgi:hypothetical protein